MGIYSGINEARGSRSGVYFTPGNYLVEIICCKEIETRQKVKAFVAETNILWSNTEERRKGSECTYYVGMDKEPALGNVADFLRTSMASLATHEKNIPTLPDSVQITEEDVLMVYGEQNPLSGVKLWLTAFNKPTKKGTDFTRHIWKVPTADQLALANQ